MSDAPPSIPLDYAVIRTQKELFEWASRAFSLLSPPWDDAEEFLKYLFEILAQRGTQYHVVEHNSDQLSPAVDRLINGFGGIEDGWRQVLGFHLSREGTGASVTFRKGHWWSTS